MYFLSDLEHKLLIHKLLPTARSASVSAELRGWNWHQPPLKPYYDEQIPMYLASSKYCPTSRDVFLVQVKKIRPPPNPDVSMGIALHRAVSDSLHAFVDSRDVSFQEWWAKNLPREAMGDLELLRRRAEKVWNYVQEECKARHQRISADQPFASDRDLMASAVPFLFEHKISGQLLGLSGILSLDCYDYLRGVMFDMKVETRPESKPEDWHRISPVGYSLVFESVNEVPVDICCVLYLGFMGDRIVIKKDLFFANDDLRSWWVEERDKKLEIVGQRKDPGVANACPPTCIYLRECRGE